MPQTCLLDAAEWRAFRLFLADLNDEDLVGVDRQLRREVAAREERDRNFTRLFFSSLQATDLQTAQQTIRAERRARARDRRISVRRRNTSSQHRTLI
jgi:hypothetical protein